jgi:hypothetical protein
MAIGSAYMSKTSRQRQSIEHFRDHGESRFVCYCDWQPVNLVVGLDTWRGARKQRGQPTGSIFI